MEHSMSPLDNHAAHRSYIGAYHVITEEEYPRPEKNMAHVFSDAEKDSRGD
jgi:hypothetical protein